MIRTLLELGFQYGFVNNEACLTLFLRQGDGEGEYRLRWYSDEPKRFYIDRFFEKNLEDGERSKKKN